MGAPVNMFDPTTGKTFAVDADQVADAQKQGFQVESEAQSVDRVAGEVREDTYGGAVGKIVTGATSFAGGATAGLSDAGLAALGYGDELRTLREVNPITAGVTNVGGAVAGAIAAPGSILARTPAAAISRLGASIAKTGEGAGAIAKLGRAGVGAATEGALFGAGQGVSQVALSKDPLTLERMLSTIGSNTLFGAATGGGFGIATKGIGIGLRKAKGALDDAASRVAATSNVSDDLAKLDRKGLRAAEVTEREALVAEQLGQRSAAVDELVAYRQAVQDANPWLAIDEGGAAVKLTGSSNQLRKALNDPEGLRKHAGGVLKPLRIQAGALEDAIQNAEAITAKLAATSKKMAKDVSDELATLPDKIDQVVLSGRAARRYGSFADVKVGKGASVSVSREEAARFAAALDNGEVASSGAAALGKLGGLLERNRALQAKIESSLVSKAELASPRLTAIAEAGDALGAGGAAARGGLVEDMLGGTIMGKVAGAFSGLPIVGPVLGAKAGRLVSDAVFGKLGGAQAAAAARVSKGIGAFLDVGGKVSPAAPVLATKVLASVAYAPKADRDIKPPKKGAKDKKAAPAKKLHLADHYKARAAELRSQTTYDVTGVPVMRPEARAKMAGQLAAVRAIDPIAADRMETTAARRIEFLSSKLPRRPDLAGVQTGPDLWQPSDMEMRTFARYAAAVEDPHAIVERMTDGSLTPEDAEAMKAVYPEMYADIQRQIIEQLPTLRETLPYARRLSLSIFSGVPVDASMDPQILAGLQGAFAAEPGTDGGVHAPIPQAQFGSVKAEKATPAQDRAG